MCTSRETCWIEPVRLPTNDQPAAYLTGTPASLCVVRAASWTPTGPSLRGGASSRRTFRKRHLCVVARRGQPERYERD